MNKDSNKLFVIILFIITALFYIQIIKLPINAFDEGTMLVGAERVLNGDIPYKNFSTAYAPGQITILAGLFKAFGTSVTTARIYDILIKTLLSLSIFIVVRFLSSSIFALGGWVTSLIWIMYKSNVVYPMYIFFLIIFTSFYFFLFYMKRDKIYFVVLCGILTALSIMFRIELGVPAAVFFIFVLILRKVMDVQKSWSPLFYYLAGGLAVGLPLLFYYDTIATLEVIFTETVLNPLAFLEHRGFPYPSLNRNTLPFYVFPLVPITSLVTSIIMVKRRNDPVLAYGVLFLSIFGIICLNQARVRSDIIHILPVALSSMILAPLLLYMLPKVIRLNINVYRTICVVFTVVFCITLYEPVKAIMLVLDRTDGFVIKVTNPDIERAKYSTIFGDIKYVAPYVKNNTSENDYIYVGVKNHDRFIYNDPLIYFLAERKCPSRYHELNPGVNNTLKGQQDIVKDLEARPPRMVILAPRWRGEPNESSIDKNINILDDYISNHFEYRKSIGIYEILIKKTNP